MMDEAHEKDLDGGVAEAPPSTDDDDLGKKTADPEAEVREQPPVNGDSGVGEEGDDETVPDVVTIHQAQERHAAQSPRPSVGFGGTRPPDELPPVVIKTVPIGEPNVRSKLRFEVVTARVIEMSGKKHVAYTIMVKRISSGSGDHDDPHPAAIERRYSDFCFVYECILRSFHPSILGDFLFPKKVLIGNFKAEVISERTDAFHKFLNLIASCDNLLYSDYFYSFLSSEEHNEAVSHVKLGRYAEAAPLLKTIFCVREKLLSVASIHVLLCACELVACLMADVHAGFLENRRRHQEAYAYAEVAMKSFRLLGERRDCSEEDEDLVLVESLRIPFLRAALQLANELGQNRKPFERQLSELRYGGARVEAAPSLLQVVRDRYIHRASHTSKIS